MALTVKAFLFKQWNGQALEIRRFSLDQDVSTSYAYLLQKIAQVFPSVKADKVALAWIDGDGDRISLSSDAELLEAMDQFDGTVFRLLIRDTSSDSHDSEPKQSSDGQSAASHHIRGTLHPGVICDGCKGPIYGIRFKCLLCPDYDLCSACEGTGGHLEHNMVALDAPQMCHPWWNSSGFRGGAFPFGQPHPLASWWGSGCGGGGGRRRCPWVKRCHRGGCGQGKEDSCCPGKSDASCNSDATTQPTEQKTEEQAQPTSAGNNGECQWSSEQHKSFLHNIGETVNSFLGPLGIKVDVDVVEDKKTPSEGTDPVGASNTPATEEDQIQIAVAQLRSMGYEDEGGWLTELVKAKKGNVEHVLEALHPSQ
ncbi:hypothetical protein EMCRGX_G033230 [Ephydatia muelleri]